MLDTHTLLWAAHQPDSLSPLVRKLLEEPREQDEVLVSDVSALELVIKSTIGKLELDRGTVGFFLSEAASSDYRVLPIRHNHLARLEALPLLHRDPFDRLLIAQAIEEDLLFATADAAIQAYPVEILW